MSGQPNQPTATSESSLNDIVVQYLAKKGYSNTLSEFKDEISPDFQLGLKSTEPVLVISATISRDGTQGLSIEQDGNLVAFFRKSEEPRLLLSSSANTEEVSLASWRTTRSSTRLQGLKRSAAEDRSSATSIPNKKNKQAGKAEDKTALTTPEVGRLNQSVGFGSRFMVDTATYAKIHPAGLQNKSVSLRLSEDKFPEVLHLEDDPPEDALLLMPPSVHGFNILTKRWELLRMEDIHEINWQKDAYDQLMLPRRTKDLVRSMVLTQDEATGQEDFISGKGDALVILLHGGPGTGKTLTAVFLRILEYYDGIIILTSNRVGTFDEAFKSRIQITIHYADLTRSSRRQIWENFFDLLAKTEFKANIEELRDHLDELADKTMNGRQIRNAITTAKRVALFRKKPLGWEHLEHVIDIAGDFDHYLERVHGHSDTDYARNEGKR
ncbi:hypothetical protein DL766_004864 [Monosporascus sp. MC13-8B]|uniref:AAA+ ATPase lid domain-containing protein n=1 Tax=Monosporascus cannonballus TaxID=155416 RepID=A0ABY0GZE2_9PEZI|nr:hypothetical protein DL762_007538 [Monosporascus cannonballus]RYO99907.1 hypothetical protein DL763_001190 [Monosporascus cannonballus]RYP30471.1 hypothetical protein DL766_004864 [Monosporascus sp. MC13-8B]